MRQYQPHLSPFFYLHILLIISIPIESVQLYICMDGCQDTGGGRICRLDCMHRTVGRLGWIWHTIFICGQSCTCLVYHPTSKYIHDGTIVRDKLAYIGI